MELKELNQYVADRFKQGLIKIESAVELSGEDQDDGDPMAFVTKTKETYNLLSESDADNLIETATQDKTCVGHDKKFKQGKTNKQGEVTRPDMYIVVLKYQF